jgi:ubiquinone/menaquinone biosynthesis C-methylase UbiE
LADKEFAELPADKLYFGTRAAGYDEQRAGKPVTAEDDAVIRAFIETFKSGAIVADAPCGTGRALAAIVGAGHHYRGADISSDMLKECWAKVPAGAKVDLALADARKLPWDDKSCDYLLSFKFIKWLPDDERVFEVLKEYRRVCRGQALVNVKIKREKLDLSLRELRDRIAKVMDRIRLGTAVRSIDRHIFETMCNRAGWKIEAVKVNQASNGIVFNYVLS